MTIYLRILDGGERSQKTSNVLWYRGRFPKQIPSTSSKNESNLQSTTSGLFKGIFYCNLKILYNSLIVFLRDLLKKRFFNKLFKKILF